MQSKNIFPGVQRLEGLTASASHEKSDDDAAENVSKVLFTAGVVLSAPHQQFMMQPHQLCGKAMHGMAEVLRLIVPVCLVQKVLTDNKDERWNAGRPASPNSPVYI
eukprot:869457-Pelagomonas_calceolata.AAC.1